LAGLIECSTQQASGLLGLIRAFVLCFPCQIRPLGPLFGPISVCFGVVPVLLSLIYSGIDLIELLLELGK
jgi:hypothetical protein